MSEKIFNILVWLVLYVVVSAAVTLFGDASLIEAFLQVAAIAVVVVAFFGLFGILCNSVEGND